MEHDEEHKKPWPGTPISCGPRILGLLPPCMIVVRPTPVVWYPGKFMGIHGNSWDSMEMRWYPCDQWISLDIHWHERNIWILIFPGENLLFVWHEFGNLDLRNVQQRMDPWILIGIHAWKSMEIHESSLPAWANNQKLSCLAKPFGWWCYGCPRIFNFWSK